MFSIPKTGRLAASVLALAAISQAGDYSTWARYRTVTVKTDGLALSAPVKKMPLLVRFSAADHADMLNNGSTQILAGGADVRVTKADGTTDVPFEIENATTGANGSLVLWVLADSVGQNSATAASFRVFWGKTGVTSLSNGKTVFDTANGYVAVWHMNADTTAGEINAAAPDTLKANVTGTLPSKPGVAGNARAFSSTANYLRVTNSASGPLNFSSETNYTFSAWVYSDSIIATNGNGHGIINKANDQYGMGIYGDANKYYDIMTRGSGSWNQAQTNVVGNELTAQTGVGTWRYVSGTWQGASTPQDTGRIYVNGVLYSTAFFNDIGNTSSGRNLTRDVYIGVLGGTNGGGTNVSRPFWGNIDEVRASKVIRDSNFIALEYATQRPAATAVAIGATQTQGGSTPSPYAAWTGSKVITLNTSATGAKVTGDVTHFPVLIRLGSAESAVLTGAKTGGADIRFSRGNTVLPYEIESWSTTAATIWVKVDTIKGNNSTQTITLHYGKNDANSESNGAAVFDTTKGFVAVYHMNGTSGEVNAAGHAELNATAVGTVGSAAGLLGNARSFADNVANFLTVPNSASGKLNFSSETDYTLSAWVFSEEVTIDNRGIFNKGNDQWLIGVYGGSEEKFYDVMTRGGGSWNQASTEPTPITTATGVGIWRHVVGVWKGSGTPQDTARIYINGALANTTFFNDIGDSSSGRNKTTDVFIGALMEGGNMTRPYHGRIDEVIASKVFRDSNWVKLAYESQKLTQAFTNVGVTVPSAPTAPQTVTAAGGSAVGSIVVSWTAPANSGGAAITGYTVTGTPTAGCTTTGALTCTITGLTPGAVYSLTVTATNSVGTSPASTAVNGTATSIAIPAAFTIHMDGALTPYTYRLPTAAIALTDKLSMTITDVQGKRVWSRSINPAATKVGEISWNGTTSKGQAVAPGLYIVRLRAEMGGKVIEAINRGVKN